MQAKAVGNPTEHLSLVYVFDKLFKFDRDNLPPQEVVISRRFFCDTIIPILLDYDEALSRRRNHCKTADELSGRLSVQNEKLRNLLRENGIDFEI